MVVAALQVLCRLIKIRKKMINISSKKKNDLENVEIVDKPMFFHKKLQLFDNLAAAAAASAEARFGCLVTNVSMLNETRLVLVIFSDIVLPRKKIA